MGKNKEMEYYQMGMERAYRIVKEDGVEALDQEMKFRNTTGIRTRLTAREIDAGMDQIKAVTIQTVLTMAMGALYVEFGFGKKRLKRFKDTFMEGTEALTDGIVTWADICENIERETKVHCALVDELGRDTGMLRSQED